MKKFFNLFTILAAAAALSISCAKEESAPVEEPSIPFVSKTVTCTIAKPDTKVSISDEGKTAWEVGDEILFHGKYAGGEYSTTVTLTADNISADGKTATFTVPSFTMGESAEDDGATDLYAIYPASAAAVDNGATEWKATNTYTTSNLPLMAGVNRVQDGTEIEFVNLTGLVSFTVDGDFDSYSFAGNKEETVGYEGYQTKIYYNTSEEFSANYTAGGKALTSVSGTVPADGKVIVAIPAGVQFEEGFNIIFSKDGKQVKVAKTATGVKIDRSQILALGDITDKLEDIGGGDGPVPFDAENFAAIDWSNKDAATWYYFKENYSLPDGFTFILHIYPNKLETSGMRVGNFGNNTESPCNMLRFGQNGNNAELEWMVDYDGGRSQKELLAPGFETEKWQAIVLTADKATGSYKIYRNDELKAEKSYAYNESMGFGAIEFANSWGKSWRSAFDGRMALLSVYNKALSAEEIKANIFTTPTSDACVGFWAMNEGKGGVLYADPDLAIKENIDLTKAIRNDDDNVTVNYEVDVTPYITWTTGNKIENGGGEDDPVVMGTKAPYMKNTMFGVTFPEEYASLDNVTMEGWVYPKSFSGAQANLPTFMGTENAFLVRFENSKPQIVLGDPVTGGGEIKASSNEAFAANQWYHIAATYARNGKIVLYVNGEQVAENNTKDYPVTFNSGVKPGTTDDAAIGRVFWVGNAFSTRWFDGNMAHLRIWNKALTQEEVKASANNKALTTADGLIANWPVKESEGVKVNDLSGNKLNTVYKTYSSAVEDAAEVTWEEVNIPDLIFAESISLSNSSLDMMKGDEKTLTVSVTPSNAMVPTITWTSSDETIAVVSNGVVTAKGVGSATITASATAGGVDLSAECEVTVQPLTGAVAPNMKNNYFRTMGGFGTLEKVTVEWKMKAKYDDPEVSSIFGKEGNWLLRVGDAGIGRNQLQLATNHDNWTTQAFFDADKWYHVAVTYDSTTGAAAVYVNGELVDSSADFASAAANLEGTEGTEVSWSSNPYSDDVNIGASYFDKEYDYSSWSYVAKNNRWLDGQMCEVRVWDTVRTADEIKANMNNLEDVSSANLKAYYKMDLTDANTGNGNTIKDYSSAAKDLTAGAEIQWQAGREDVEPAEPVAK